MIAVWIHGRRIAAAGWRTPVQWFVVLALALALVGCAGDATGGRVIPGQPAPDFAARSVDGSRLSLDDLRGEVVVLNIWATWCGPCVREMPALEQLHRDLGDSGLRVVGVSIDRGAAEPDVRRFLDDYDITFTVLLDPDQTVTSTFRTVGVPETFLIDRDGIIAHRWFGEFDPGEQEVRNELKELLAVPSAH